MLDFIKYIENTTGKKAKKNMLPLQQGDVPKTWADVTALNKDFEYKPEITIELGVKNFVNWYFKYYNKD